MADDLAAMLSISAQQANTLFSNAGGNVERAVSMYFSAKGPPAKHTQPSHQISTEDSVVELLDDDNEEDAADLIAASPSQRADASRSANVTSAQAPWARSAVAQSEAEGARKSTSEARGSTQLDGRSKSSSASSGLLRYFGSPSKGPSGSSAAHAAPASPPAGHTTRRHEPGEDTRSPPLVAINVEAGENSEHAAAATSAGMALSPGKTVGRPVAALPATAAAQVATQVKANDGYRPVDSPVAWYDPIRHAAWAVTTTTSAQAPPRSPTGVSGYVYVHHPLPNAGPYDQGAAGGAVAVETAPKAGSGTTPYVHLARAYSLIEPLTTRTRIYGCLVNMYRTILATSPSDTLPALLLTANMGGTLSIGSTSGVGEDGERESSRGEAHVLTLGDSTLASAICDVSGIKRDSLRSLFTHLGDLGDVAERCCSAQRTLVPPPPLTVTGLYESLLSLAKEKGSGCAGRKQACIARLLRSAARSQGEAETRYVVRTLLQHLRIGVNLITALQCLARAVAFNEATGTVHGAAVPTPAKYTIAANGGAGSDESTQPTEQKGKGKKAPVVKRGVNALASGTSSSASSSSQATVAFGATGGGVTGAQGRWTGPHGGSQEGLPESVHKHMEHAAAVMKRCYSVCPSVPVLVHALLQHGVQGMSNVCVPTVGTPLRPMLARITQGPQEALLRYQWLTEEGSGQDRGLPFTAEWKYDGQRAQVHLLQAAQGPRCRIFSRHLDDTTAKWPEICHTLCESVPAAWSARAAGRTAEQSDEKWVHEWQAALAACQALQTAVEQHPRELDPLAEAPLPLTSVILDGEIVAVEALPVSPMPQAGPGTPRHQHEKAPAQASGPAVTAALQAGLLTAEGAHGGDPTLRILPFSMLATRSRLAPSAPAGASAGAEQSSSISTSTGPTVALYVFDLLSLNGIDLTHLPLHARRALLYARVPPIVGRLAYAHAINVRAQSDIARNDSSGSTTATSSSSSFDESMSVPALLEVALLEYLKQAVSTGCEGLMCKLLTGHDSEGQGPSQQVGGTVARGETAAVDDDDDEGSDDEVASVSSSPAEAAAEAAVVEGDLSDNEVEQQLDSEPLVPMRPATGEGAPGKRGASARSGPPAKRARPSASKVASATAVRSTSAGGLPVPVSVPVFAARPTGHTGRRVPPLLATYQPSARSNAWLKVKKDYVEGLADSFDLVVMGGWWGNGRKAGWFSPLLLGCWDPRSEMWQSLCRCMSGWSDAEYTVLAQFYKDPANQLSPEEASAVYHSDDPPAVWFRPLKVMEVRGADLTLSPVHMAGQGRVPGSSRGIGLRFPRCLREREDKSPEDATTSTQIAQMFQRQAQVGGGRGEQVNEAEED